jgi:Transposase DDE domain.
LSEKIEVVPATVGERYCIKNFIKDTDFLYLFDKGYYKYSWYDEMSDRGINFITRQQGNAITEEYKSYHTGLEDIYD